MIIVILIQSLKYMDIGIDVNNLKKIIIKKS
jgi:hypothetical protein